MAKESVKPTRMELLNTKQKLLLAQKGHKLLKQKRDALVLEFFSILKQAKDLRTQLDNQTVAAYKALAIALCFHGELFLETASLYSHSVPEISVTSKNVMGVRIPAIRGTAIQRSLLERGYSLKESSAKFDAVVQAFEETLNFAVKLAETEGALKRLLSEIQKTNRRVNALEYNIQPDLRDTIKTITESLNRLESERFFALKLTKKRLKEKAEKEYEEMKAKA